MSGPLTGRARIDSITAARKHIADSTRAARKRITDSTIQARKRILDSTREARARALDSMRAERKRITDSTVKARKRKLDSTRKARARALDSAKKSRERIADSIRTARQERIDSITKERKERADSIAAIREYRTSKHYKDSVQEVRQARIDSIRDERQERLDSIKTARQRITDSITTARQERTDSIRAVQKARSDSLAAIREYRSSKRYKDSVTLVRRHRMDSIAAVREAYRDSLADARKHILDSTKTARAKILDSIKNERQHRIDSLKLVRKARMDSLEKKKADREKLAKAKEKKKQEKLKMELELKLKKKREAWSNESMLKKRWSPLRRVFQNSFTRYNYYFNARRKMQEARENMLRVAKDDYDVPIKMYPFDPNTDSSLLAGDMDSIIQKVSVGIQIHDPRTKWADDLYLLLGQAYFYKGGYENAATAFRYIIASDQKSKNKKKGSSSYRSKSASIVDTKKKSKLNIFQHKPVHNDAILWLARTYTTAGQVESAEAILSLLEFEPKLPANVKGKLAAEKAYAYLKAGNKEEASKQLSIAAADDNLPQYNRMRMAFLNGQLLQEMGSYNEAAESFRDVLKHYPKIEMDFYARKYIAYNKLMAGSSVAAAVGPLKKTLKDGKYASYNDQVYYVLGNLAVQGNRNQEALTYFHKSTTTPKASRKQKALSFSAMGNVYYSLAKYSAAKVAYDSAAKYSSAAGKDKSVAAAVQRSAGLKEISGPAQAIHDQDSLLTLAAMSKRSQQSIVRKQIRALEKQRDDSIFNAENSSVVSLPVVDAASGGSGSTSWYFSNPTLMTRGKAEFKQKWGNRPLTDNWRRSAAVAAAGGTGVGSGSSDSDEEAVTGTKKEVVLENGIPTEESLLAQIPNTKAEKDEALKTIQRSYVLLAKAYVKQLEDYDRALQALDTLDKRFPKHRYKEEELFLRYEIAVKQSKLDKAQGYANELLSKFPESEYADLLKPSKSESKQSAANTTEVAAYFDKTYDLLMKHQYTEVLMRTDVAKEKFGNKTYAKRFWVTEAMAHAGQGNYDMADTVLKKFIATHPKDSLTDWAKSVQEYVVAMRKGGKPAWYREGPPPKHWEPRKKTEDAVAAAKPDMPPAPPPPPPAPAMYAYHADSAHYCIVVFPGLDSRTRKLKMEVQDFDTKLYGHPYHELLIDMYNSGESVLLVSAFANAADAKEYQSKLSTSDAINNYGKSDAKVLVISKYNYKKMFADKSSAAYVPFYNIFYNK